MKFLNITLLLAVVLFTVIAGGLSLAGAENAGAETTGEVTGTLDASDAGQVVATMEQRFVDKVDAATLFGRLTAGMDDHLSRTGHSVPYFSALKFRNDVKGNSAVLDKALKDLAGSGKCKVEPSQLLISGLKYMMASVKDHGTKFFGPGEYAPSLEERGYNIGGCGFYVDEKNAPEGGFICFMVVKGFPAEKAGIMPGDRLIKVDNRDVTKLDFEGLAALVRGPIGASVCLTMIRKGEIEPLEFTIKRTWLSPNTTSYDQEIFEDGTAHVHLRYLGKHVDIDMKDLLTELKKKGVRKLVLDLRNNEGDMEGAITMAGLFLPKDALVADRVYRDSVEPFRNGEAVQFTLPMVVLVNRYTSSSATILAGALQDAKVATVVGSPTRWGYSIKEPEDIKNCRFTITRGYYRLPLGRIFRMEGDKLEPDVTVQQGPFDQNNPEKDYQLKKALNLLKGK